MKLLLDTHIFLWYIAGEERINERVLALIRDPQNAVYLSVISEWETIIKYQIGRLPLPEPPGSYIPTQRRRHRIGTLPLEESDVATLMDLPGLHKDPFDRMLIAQAIHQDMMLITVDKIIQAYANSTTLMTFLASK
jgi:PIN domain nuclease of toxin-antitoxin system